MDKLRVWLDSLANYPLLFDLLREFLMPFYPAILALLLSLLLVFLLLSLPRIRQDLKSFNPRIWPALLVIFLTGLALRLWYSPHHPQVLYDEVYFFNLAKELAASGRDILVEQGFWSAKPKFFPAPIGFELLLAGAFKLLGSHDYVAFYLNILLSSFSLALLFYVAAVVTGSAPAALLSSAAWAVLPVGLRIAGSAALEPLTLFGILLTLSLCLLNLRQGDLYTRLAALLSWLALVHVRQEGLLAFTPLFLGFWLLYTRRRVPWRDPIWYLQLFLSLYFLLPYVLVVFYGMASHFYFFTEPTVVLKGYIKSNYLYNALFFFDNKMQPLGFTLLALLGLWGVNRRAGWFLGGWILWSYLFYSGVPSCDFALRHTVDSWRISLFVLLPLIMLTGLGADWLARRLKPALRVAWLAALLLYLVWLPIQYRGFVSTQTFLTSEYLRLKAFAEQPSGYLAVSCSKLDILRKPNLTQMVYWAGEQEVKIFPEDQDELLRRLRLGENIYLYHLGARVNLTGPNQITLWDKPAQFYPGIWSQAYQLKRGR